MGEGLGVAGMLGWRKTSVLTLGEMEGDPNVEDKQPSVILLLLAPNNFSKIQGSDI